MYTYTQRVRGLELLSPLLCAEQTLQGLNSKKREDMFRLYLEIPEKELIIDQWGKS